ncbi:response regulator FixJ [soil metagenome]
MTPSKMPPEAIVYVVDDDEAARDSLAFLLRTAGFEVRTYAAAASFLAEFAILPPGCLITDMRMPGMDGLDLLRELQRQDSAMPAIVITGHGDIPLAVEAMKLGATDFLEKPFDDTALLTAVGNGLRNRRERSRQDEQRSSVQRRLESLSARERQVLDGLISGHPNKIIAYDLGISIRTIEIYRANVMTKMQAGSLSELIRMTLGSDIKRSA